MATNITFGFQDKEKFAKVNKLGITSYTERKYEPQTQNTFSFEFLFDEAQVAYIATYANRQISPITGASKIPADNYTRGLGEINERLNSSMQNLNAPTKQIGQIVIDFFNSQIKYAGKATYSNATITFNTLIGLGTKNVLAGWSDLCLSDRTIAGGWARTEPGFRISSISSNIKRYPESYLNALFPHTGYKCDGILLECARDGTIVNQWKYIGMWIQTFNPGSYNMAGSSTPSQTSATIVVDKIEQMDIEYLDEATATEA